MELSSTIIGIVCIILFFVPIYFLSRSGASKRKQRLSALLALSEKNGLRLSAKEVWNDYTIGIDDTSKQVVYVKNAEEDHQEILIQLKDIARCSINNISREVKTSAGTQRIIEQIELQFFHKKAELPPVSVEFYDGKKQMQLSGELQLAEKWAALVKKALA
jgi:hypothetical protein